MIFTIILLFFYIIIMKNRKNNLAIFEFLEYNVEEGKGSNNMPKKLPNGISNYEELVEDGYTYVDKTMYIQKLEELTDKNDTQLQKAIELLKDKKN